VVGAGPWHAADVRILVIEDDEHLARSLRRGLEAEGFAVDVAADGTDGLWQATELPYDAVVLDIMLPGTNGYRVCSTLRERGVWTPILMLTAKHGELDEAEALDTGADDFLAKPFAFVVLVARLRALLRRGQRARPAVLSAGEMRLDPAERRAWIGKRDLGLTARQLAVLEVLLRRPGEAVSKQAILDAVWDDAFDGSSNIVEVHIAQLRKRGAVIETVRGVGYRVPV
jgi:DNA-binding response OmpR family regulator